MPSIKLMTPSHLEGLATARSNDLPVHLGFTAPKLALAFSRVEPFGNWKNPIDQQFDHTLTRAEKLAIAASIGFYTGGGSTFSENAKGTRVTSRGYYVVIGA